MILDFRTMGESVTLVKKIEQPTGISLCQYSPDGRYFVCGLASGDLQIRDANSDYQLIRALNVHMGYMNDIQFSPSGRYMATVATDMAMRVWDVHKDFELTTVWYAPTNKIDFLDENTIVTGEATGNFRFVKYTD